MISPIRAIAAREVAWKSAIAGAIARVDDTEALNGATYSDVLARRNEEETKHPSLATYLRRMTQIGFVPKLKDAKRDQDTEAKKAAEEAKAAEAVAAAAPVDEATPTAKAEEKPGLLGGVRKRFGNIFGS